MIIKPDAIKKGLVGIIVDSLQKHSLVIQETARAQLAREDIDELYFEHKSCSFYPELVDFLTTAPVILIQITGENAVHKAKYQIIGKYYNLEGLRRKYSESYIKNIAHVSSSAEEAKKELCCLKKYFQEEKTMNQKKLGNITVFALTGLSECGKSTVGKYFDSESIPRLKIAKIFETIKSQEAPAKDLTEFVLEQEKNNPFALWDSFLGELTAEMQRIGAKNASIESLYGGGLGPHLKQKLGKNFCLIYIDVPLETRLQRQITREGLGSLEEAKKLLLPRDQFKIATGILKLKEVADVVIDNSGTIEDLHQQIDQIINKYCR